ncbi:MAG TPA: hypothetical protein VE871_14075 [Longimicrobium sp.]|nr:hypothetical protein [Longimicrobium sp.]
MRIHPFSPRRAPAALRGTARRLAFAAALLAGAAAAAPAPAQAQDITVCADQAVPQGYAVVAAGKGQQCPGYYAPGINVLTLRLPGDTVSVCSAYTQSLADYIVTARGKRQECPNYYGPGENSASYRRIAQPYTPPPPPPPALEGEGAMEWLDEYRRYVVRRLRTAEGRLRLDEPTHDTWIDVTGTENSASIGFEMEPGVRHTLVAVCDQDCSAVSFRVIDPRGAIVAVSEASTQPVVRLPPAVAGRWTVEASVQACSAATCRFGVGIYETPQGSVAPPQGPPPSPRPRPRP